MNQGWSQPPFICLQASDVDEPRYLGGTKLNAVKGTVGLTDDAADFTTHCTHSTAARRRQRAWAEGLNGTISINPKVKLRVSWCTLKQARLQRDAPVLVHVYFDVWLQMEQNLMGGVAGGPIAAAK